MKSIFTICFLLTGIIGVYSQPAKSDTAGSDKVYRVVQQQPKFPGEINKYLGDSLIYPKDAQTNNIQGTVYVSFIVEKDGLVSGTKVMRGIPGGKSLDDEAVRVVSSMPRWTPGMQNGKPVRVQYMVPIHFMLPDKNASDQKKN